MGRLGDGLLAYPARIARDRDGRYLVRFRDLPEALTDGATLAEARKEAADCLSEALMSRVIDREDLPTPSPIRRGERLVAPEATVALKAAIYRVMRDRSVNVTTLSRTMGVDPKEARRIVDPRHPTKQRRLADVLEALGYEVLVAVRQKDAA